jgi:hypothetical protein
VKLNALLDQFRPRGLDVYVDAKSFKIGIGPAHP